MATNGASTRNTATVVLGSQWGDEGKGKIVDLLATEMDMVCRCQVRSGCQVSRCQQDGRASGCQHHRLMETVRCMNRGEAGHALSSLPRKFQIFR